MSPARIRHLPFWRHPAGLFFALAGVQAAALPWLWILPVSDPRLLHLRLGLFGFAGAAITGYVLTALPAWTKHPLPLPVPAVLVAFVLARLAGVCLPDIPWAVLPPQTLAGAAVIWPVLATGLWRRALLAAMPLALGPVEVATVKGALPMQAVPLALATLILLVGGRAVPAFLAAEAKREGRSIPSPGPLWLAALLAGTAVASARFSYLASLACSALILWRAFPTPQAGTANRMLGLAWSTLAITFPALLLVPEGVARVAAEHLFLTATMGGTVFAFGARATMRRLDSGTRLAPHPAQVYGFLLLLVSAPLRAAAVCTASPEMLFITSGLCWSLAWVLFLIPHLAAYRHPAPFPVLSGSRML